MGGPGDLTSAALFIAGVAWWVWPTLSRVLAGANSGSGCSTSDRLHEQAVRLRPRYPQIGYWYHRIGMVRLLQSRIEEAIPWLEKGLSAIPTFPLAYSFLGAAYALNGETERGAAELAETYRLSGKVWVSTIADMKVTGYWGPPKIRALYESVYFRRPAQTRPAGGVRTSAASDLRVLEG